METTVGWEGRRTEAGAAFERRPATIDDLINVTTFFESNNIPYWLHGGWVVEAILGKPVPHDDVDIFTLKEHQQRIRTLAGESLLGEYPNRLILDINACKVDVAFVSPFRGNRLILAHPQAIWIFPERAFGNEKGTIHGREFSIVSPYIVYMEQSHTVWRKKKSREKFAERVRQLNKVMSAEEIAEARKWWPKKNHVLNRLLYGVRP